MNKTSGAASSNSTNRLTHQRLNNLNTKSVKSLNPRTLPPRRYLSANGSTDFYRVHSPYLHHHQHPPITRLNKSPTSLNCNAASASRIVPLGNNNGQRGRSAEGSVSGKNTWNGNTKRSASSSRIRPNLFQANYFNNNGEFDQTQNEGDGQTPSSDEAGSQSLNLAEWIKKALELDSDAAKISQDRKSHV